VKTDNNVHVVFVNGIVCEDSEVSLLVSRVELASRNLGPGCVGSGDTESVNALSTHLIDIGDSEEGSVTLLEDRPTD
jgi:hypothetical protein